MSDNLSTNEQLKQLSRDMETESSLDGMYELVEAQNTILNQV